MNIIPTIYIAYLLLHEVQLLVEFFGEMEEFHNIVKVTLNCYFSTGSHDCSAEFLYNKETIDNLRASNDKCYHKNKLCKFDTCACSNECKQYTLILTNTYFTDGDIFGCEVHYNDAGYIHRLTTEILFNGSDFLYHNTLSNIVARPDKDSSSTKPPKTRKPITRDEIFIVLLSVLVTIIVCGLPITFIAIRRRNKDDAHNDLIMEHSMTDALFVLKYYLNKG
ncbi:uncharacterized protein LOC134683738 [Mytilus trossulus]|uniref:uncharacterized protein LOC134683738 n=1 Tax=Mytilus trossulus TaxID=6551 RepID=UPI00300717F6